MADALPNDKLSQYLAELTPQARALLVTELERAQLRGESPPGASAILAQLRKAARSGGHKLPRVGNPQRLFFSAIEPFLVNDTPERKHIGRIARASLDPIWQWICRDLIPREARAYTDQVNLLLAAREQNGVDQVARAFQDLAEQRLRECLATIKSDEKAWRRVAGQIGTPHAIDELRELAAILRARDALAVIGSRLPASIGNLADAQLDNVKALLDSPIGRHRDVFVYALLIVMSRLASPWQLIRLAINAAKSDAPECVAATPFAVAVDIVLADLDRIVANLGEAVQQREGADPDALLKDFHDTARALHTEIELDDSAWGRQLAASRAEIAGLLQAEIENLPAQVRRLLRPRSGRDSINPLDSSDVDDLEAKLAVAATCRTYASELAISETALRVHSELETFFDSGAQVLLDRLRAPPPPERALRQGQVDAAIRFCAKLFGGEYASLLIRAADIAARGEQKLAKA